MIANAFMNVLHATTAFARQSVLTLCVLLPITLFTGCGKGEEHSALESADRELQKQEPLADLPVIDIKDSEVIDLVLDSSSSLGTNSTRRWVELLETNTRGQVMFPQWTVTRRSSNRYDVRYLYTVIDEGNSMTKKGYSWHVDVALKIVGPPREFTPTETPYKPRELNSRQLRRIQQEEQSLE